MQIRAGSYPRGSLLSLNSDLIGDKIADPCFGKYTKPQPATIARAARRVCKLVAGPSAIQRRARFHFPLYNFPFLHAVDRRLNFEMSFRPRSFAH
jgi:hypothetical protein